MPGGGWELVVASGQDAGRRYPVAAPLRLGRGAENDVALADPQASRRHALVQPQGQGLLVRDLGSSNGTFVNEAAVREPVWLRHGDVLRVGVTTFQVVAPRQAQAAAASDETMIAASPVAAPAVRPASGAVCARCGQPLYPGNRFCEYCGAPTER